MPKPTSVAFDIRVATQIYTYFKGNHQVQFSVTLTLQTEATYELVQVTSINIIVECMAYASLQDTLDLVLLGIKVRSHDSLVITH